MFQKERIESITDLLKKNGFVTVKFLCDELHYSTATINRDLNFMQQQKLIKRSYGGAELIKRDYVPLMFRYNKMRPSKNKIGKITATYINDGDTIFLDGSTTTQYISKYITEKKNLTIITNNMALVSFFSEYDIKVICLGGRIIEKPYILGGEDTVENIMKYHADKFFFSTGGVTVDGEIISGGISRLMHKMMSDRSKEVFYLADYQKITDNVSGKQMLFSFDKVDYVITDYVYSDEVKNKFCGTRFIEI